MKKNTLLIIFTTILILTACATPPTPAPIPTATLAPPTQTPLPPTPDLDAILPPEIAEEYTLRTDNNETFRLQDKDGNILPEISLDIDGNIFFGEENTPANLEIKNEELLITQGDKTLLFTGEGWANIPNQFPKDFSKDWTITAESITDKDGVVKYELDIEAMEWVKAVEKYEGAVRIKDYSDNPLTLEDFEPGGKVDTFFAKIKPEIMAQIDWEDVDDSFEFRTIDGAFTYPWRDDGATQFENFRTNPFIRDFSKFGISAFGEIIAKFEEKEYRYIFMPLIIIDVENKDIYFIKLAMPLQKDGKPTSQGEIDWNTSAWENEMHLSLIEFGAKPFQAETDDPLFMSMDELLKSGGLSDQVFSELVNKPMSEVNLILLDKLKNQIFMTEAFMSTSNIYK